MGRRHEFDTPWKEALFTHFPQFFAFFYPEIFQDIDWSHPPRHLDKELQKLAPDSRTGRKIPDGLVQVRRRGGEDALVLVHIEVQSHEEAGFAQRMLEYHARIYLHYKQPICSLAILGDWRSNWRPSSQENRLWNCRWTFEYGVVKLLDYHNRLPELECSTNPFALLVAATLYTHSTSPSSESRRFAKGRLVRGLHAAGLSKEQVRGFFRMIDWVLTLSPNQSKIFDQELEEFERSINMPYISSTERNYMAKYLEKGLAEGLEQEKQSLRTAILLAFASRFGTASAAFESAILSVTDRDRLIALVGVVASAATPEEAERSLLAE